MSFCAVKRFEELNHVAFVGFLSPVIMLVYGLIKPLEYSHVAKPDL